MFFPSLLLIKSKDDDLQGTRLICMQAGGQRERQLHCCLVFAAYQRFTALIRNKSLTEDS